MRVREPERHWQLVSGTEHWRQYMDSTSWLQQEIDADWRISICQNGSSLVFKWSIRNRNILSTGLICHNMINSNMIEAVHSLRYECCMLYGLVTDSRYCTAEKHRQTLLAISYQPSAKGEKSNQLTSALSCGRARTADLSLQPPLLKERGRKTRG